MAVLDGGNASPGSKFSLAGLMGASVVAGGSSIFAAGFSVVAGGTSVAAGVFSVVAGGASVVAGGLR